MKKNRICNNRSLIYERPIRTIWTDKLIQHCIDQLKKGFTHAQIAKSLDINKYALKNVLSCRRKKPEWAGKIPYIKINQRPILAEQGDKIGVLDIEFFSFGGNKYHLINARLGTIISYALKEFDKNVWYAEKIRMKDLRNRRVMDRRITENLIKNLSKFDVVVGFFSNGCDLPFIRTRALHYGIEFPLHNTIKSIDLFQFAKRKLLLDHNSLRSVSKLLDIEGKDNIELDEWFYAALCGDGKSLQAIYEHNLGDVRATEGSFRKIKPYLSNSLGSI